MEFNDIMENLAGELDEVVQDVLAKNGIETPVCVMCGKSISSALPALKEQHLCSWRCWGELYGEP